MIPKVLIKLRSANAVEPTKTHPTDAGWDLTATEMDTSYPGLVTYKTGLSVQVPGGFVALCFGRSSIRSRGLTLVGGVIDAGYTGEIEVSFLRGDSCNPYTTGDRICQLVILPLPNFVLHNIGKADFPVSARGDKGFGSSGN